MTAEQAKSIAPIIQAFAEGKSVEMFEPNHEPGSPNLGAWVEIKDPTFDLAFKWRVKPQTPRILTLAIMRPPAPPIIKTAVLGSNLAQSEYPDCEIVQFQEITPCDRAPVSDTTAPPEPAQPPPEPA